MRQTIVLEMPNSNFTPIAIENGNIVFDYDPFEDLQKTAALAAAVDTIHQYLTSIYNDDGARGIDIVELIAARTMRAELEMALQKATLTWKE